MAAGFRWFSRVSSFRWVALAYTRGSSAAFGSAKTARERTEPDAGLTTFLTTASLLAVNLVILAGACVSIEGARVARAMATRSVGLNADFAYTMVPGLGATWQTALGAVFISGTVFMLPTLGRIRELGVRTVPTSLWAA